MNTKESVGKAFTSYVMERIKKDNAFGAALRRADNPATEYQSWEYLSSWCDLDKPWERLPFVAVSAAIARAKPTRAGSIGLGKAIADCYHPDGNKSDQAKSKLRRILACESTDELCLVLRPILSLIASHGIHLDYGRLLEDLLWFGNSSQRIKIHWAQDFFGKREEK